VVIIRDLGFRIADWLAVEVGEDEGGDEDGEEADEEKVEGGHAIADFGFGIADFFRGGVG
jgi:hypothetical protein